jgi:glycosyltransferase involved in cell wall biosynthesis
MEQYCRKNKLNNQVLFKGKIHPEEMVAEYQSAHLMIAPSLNEGMSIAALEALSSGVYLIATKASGYPDMITEGINGTQVEFRDPAGLAEAIRDYYRSKFLANSRLDNDFLAQFQQSFSWLGINQQYNDVLLKKTNEIS